MARILGIYPNYIELYGWQFRILKNHRIDIISNGYVQSGKVVKKLSKGDIPEENIDNMILPSIFNNPLDYILKLVLIFLMIPGLAMRRYKLVVFWGPPHFLAILSPLFRLFGMKTAVYIIDDWVESAIYQRGVKTRFFMNVALRFVEFVAVKSANQVFTVCEYLKNLYMPFNKNIVVGPTSIDMDVVDKIKPERMFRETTVVYVGALFEYKGILLLAKAFEIVKKQVSDVKLLIIGNGPAMDELKKMSEKNPDIVLTGGLDYEKTVALTKGTDIAVIPFKKVSMNWTGSPQKCFDYIGCHVPIVYTGGGQHSIFIKQFDVGIESEDNPEDLAEKIVTLIKDRKKKKKLKSNCEKFAREVDYRKLLLEYKNRVDQLVE